MGLRAALPKGLDGKDGSSNFVEGSIKEIQMVNFV